jgi:hypothetical protein
MLQVREGSSDEPLMGCDARETAPGKGVVTVTQPNSACSIDLCDGSERAGMIEAGERELVH